jgi:hypothetical protein
MKPESTEMNLWFQWDIYAVNRVDRRSMKRALVPFALVLLLLSAAGPIFATIPLNSDIVITCGAADTPCPTTSVPIGGTATINMCMSNGQTGEIWNTNSKLGTSGLLIKSPGGKSTVDPTGATTAWTYSPAAYVFLPACNGQPLPSVCPTPPVVPGANQALECKNGEYSVTFGAGASGWVRLSGPKVAQTAEGGTYTVDVNYKQGNAITHHTAFFDASTYFPTPEFGVSAAAVAGVSLLGLVFFRRRFVK